MTTNMKIILKIPCIFFFGINISKLIYIGTNILPLNTARKVFYFIEQEL